MKRGIELPFSGKITQKEGEVMLKGKQSILFDKAPYIVSTGNVVGKKEGEGPLGKQFDYIEEENLFGQDTWEEAESEMQKKACLLALEKARVAPEDVRYIFGGDLLRQGIATSMGIEELHIPLFGLYGACSTSGEALALSSMSVAAGYGERVLAVTSSHFGSAEKEFRFPLAYANQRPLSSQWTVTGSGAFLVGTEKSHVRVAGVTVGKIVDYGLKDSQNMGACMAPAACDTILQNLKDFERNVEDYDHIFTGDLGYVGQSILFDLLEKEGILLLIKPHPMDAICNMKLDNSPYIKVFMNKDLDECGVVLYELLAECDVLLTDYSSVFIDFLNLDRPIAFVCDDIESYAANRGFCFEPVKEYLPGEIVRNYKELESYLKNLDEINERWTEKRAEINQMFNCYSDNQSAKRVFEFIAKQTNKR